MAQVWAGLDGGHGYESNAGILEMLSDRVTEDGANRLVDASHPAGAHRTRPDGS
jgi:hypothetical protein